MSNQPNQTPQGGQQVPDHRVDQLMERLRTIELQNQQLRSTIDHMSRGQQPQQQSQAEQQFKPEVLQALKDVIRAEITPVKSEMQNHVGMVYDATDDAKFRLQYSDPKYTKLYPKVEELRRQAQAQNRWISREDALKMVYFEETGHKAQEAPAQIQPQAQQPLWSPYFQTFVDPKTGMPVQAPDAMAAQQAPQAPQEPQVESQTQPQAQHPGMPWQQPQAQPGAQAPQQPQAQGNPYQARPPQHGMNPNHPMANPFGLPAQGVAPAAAPQQAQNQGPMNLDLDASDDQLAAFESKFGELPL